MIVMNPVSIADAGHQNEPGGCEFASAPGIVQHTPFSRKLSCHATTCRDGPGRGMTPVIIVNVGHSPAKDAMTLRDRDFSPTRIPQYPNSGGGPAFLDFLEHELIPFIDRTYRTNTSDRGIPGHSMGGLFALYALEQRPALFQRIVAASPALSPDNVVSREASRALRALPVPVRLDLPVGSDDELGFTKTTTALASVLDNLKPKGLDYRFTLYPGQNHNSVRLVSFPAGLYWVYGAAK